MFENESDVDVLLFGSHFALKDAITTNPAHAQITPRHIYLVQNKNEWKKIHKSYKEK